MIWLHRYAKLVAASTLLLIAAGGMVTSTGSGLSVPDWPNTYGWFMFSFPMDKWVGGIFYEHSHRLIASTVGFLTIVLAIWTWRVEPRAWVRWLGLAALGAVILQGLLGGLTVLLLLPAPVSIGHAGLAQLFFCITLTLAVVTSPWWKAPHPALHDDHAAAARDRHHAGSSTCRFCSARPCGIPVRGWRSRRSHSRSATCSRRYGRQRSGSISLIAPAP